MPKFDFIEDAEVREKVENAHKLEVDALTIDLTNSAKTQVETAVSGLKTKNEEILGEKKALQDKMKPFDGIDLEAVKVATEFYDKNKDAEFLKNGTVDELIEKRTSALTSDFEVKIQELTTSLEESKIHGAKYQGLFESKVIDDGLRSEAVKQGVRSEAIDDVVLRGRSIFSLDDKKQIEARNSDGSLSQTEDKKVLTTKNWIEGLKETSPHYWPGSEGAGALGGGGGSETDLTKRLNELASTGKMTEYRALRDKHKKK